MSFQVACLPARTDNYIFVLHDAQTAAVVDPAEPEPVLRCLAQLGLPLTTIFNTHHHHDHVGANLALREAFPGLQIYASRQDQGRIPGQTVALDEGDQVTFAGEIGQVFFIPGHTLGHIAYYFPGNLFCGDTLFAGSCGRLFEGTPAQMLASLDRLQALPPETKVWCAHEYTLNNLKFACQLEPENQALQARYTQVQQLRQLGLATIPSTIGMERATNPFLRLGTGPNRVQLFAQRRALKDRF